MLVHALALFLAANREGPTVHTAAEWRADLDYLVQQVTTEHPLPWQFGVSEDEFARQAAQLSKDIPTMSDGRILLEILRVFGSIDDSHSEPYWNTVPEKVIDMRIAPVRFRHFSDGVFVTQSLAGLDDLLGAELLAIEAKPVDLILEELMKYQSGDNPIRRRTVAVEVALTRPGILHVLGLCSSPTQITYTMRMATGKIELVTLTTRSGPSFHLPQTENEATVRQDFGQFNNRKWTHWNDQESLPLYQQDRGRRYWFEYLPESKVLYMRFARVIDDPAESFDDFTDRMFAFIARNEVEKLVIDARRNRGGYGNFGLKLVDRISKHEVGEKGRLFMIMGRGSKSATPFFAWRLERKTVVTFVGEPSGGRPTPFGSTQPFTLPNSGMQLRLAGAVFDLTGTPDPRKTITPELKVEVSSSDFVENHDPVLDAILSQ